ncbi:MAG: glycosyltransferase family 52 [Fusobacteriaceae bacterium]
MRKNLIVGTNYSLLIGLLILDKKDIFFIFCNKISEKISNKIPSEKKYISKIYLNKKNIFGYYFEYFKTFKFFQKIKLEENYITDYLLEFIFLRGKSIVIEDGVANYTSKGILVHKNKLKQLLKLDFRKEIFGYSKNIKKIYLTGLAPIPKEIAHKVEIINLKELWNKKSSEEQDEILDIFSFDLDIKDKIKNRDIILFTQPLSEDGVITEREKIDIYSKIIKKYPQERLIIKTHPREKTNYKELFKENLVLDNPFPFEILSLLDIKFARAVTLFSTAALGLGENVDVDFYGTEINEKIFLRFGSCDNIMKRNSYLEEE